MGLVHRGKGLRVKSVISLLFLCHVFVTTAEDISEGGKEWVRQYIRSEEESDHADFSMSPGEREGRAPERVMYLNQGVEFVFPLGVHYTLANVNEQQNFPVPTTGFEAVLEFPRNKMAIMFSSMVNTLRLANFSVHSTIYSNESSVQVTPAMRILGTEVKPIEQIHAPATVAQINRDIATQTQGLITDFIPKPAYYGSAVYPFTKSVLANTIQYENYWAWPWKDGGFDRFSDSLLVPYMEVDGLMPYYENEAFAAVAALFKGGTGSVVFLKPKGNVTILQLMLQPTALTEIFDENFPGWGVKTMRVKVPAAAFTTTTRHAETLQKRGVVDTFCSADVRENLFGVLRVASSYFLNPIVQTNHVDISKERFRIASATGATLNSQADYDAIPRNDPIYTDVESSEGGSVEHDVGSSVEGGENITVAAPVEEDPSSSAAPPSSTTPASSSIPPVEEEVVRVERVARSAEVIGDEPEAVTEPVTTLPPVEDAPVPVVVTEDIVAAKEDDEEASVVSDVPAADISPPAPVKPAAAEPVSKGGKRGGVQIESYVFDEPFLWFLHATNEEPMFMGIIESFKRYKEQASNNVISLANNHKFVKDGSTSGGNTKLPIVDVISDTANINLWNC